MQRNTQMHNKLCSSERRDQAPFIIIIINDHNHNNDHQAMTALLTGVVMVLVVCHSPKVVLSFHQIQLGRTF